MKTTKIMVLAAILCCTACGRNRTTDTGYILKDVLEVAGRQGVATDGSFYYVSGSTVLYKYDLDGNLILSNEAPFRDLEKECNHIGDIDVHQGEIFAGCELFMDGEGTNIQVAVYDASSLEYKRSIQWNGQSGQVECCGLAVDRDKGQVWMADWVQGESIYCYDLGTGEYVRSLALSPAPSLQQGIFCLDGKMLISCDDGDADSGSFDNIYSADLGSGEVTLFRKMDDFILTGEIEGLTVNPLNGDLVVLSNRGARIILGMPKGFYEGYDKEIHNLYIYSKK